MKRIITAAISIVAIGALAFGGYKYYQNVTTKQDIVIINSKQIENKIFESNDPPISPSPNNESQNKIISTPVETSETLPSKLRLRSLDGQTGIAVIPDLIELNHRENKKIKYQFSKKDIEDNGIIVIPLLNGTYDITVSASGYRKMASLFSFNDDSLNVDFNLVSLFPYEGMTINNIQKLHREDGMVIVGFVVDDVTGKPLTNVNISTRDNIVQTETNSMGFFKLIIPLPNKKEIVDRNIVLFSINGYKTELIKNFDMYPNGDIGLKIRLQPGSDTIINSIISHREVEIITID